MSANVGDRDPKAPGPQEKPHEMRIKRGDGNGGDPVRSPSGGQPYARRLATLSGGCWMKKKGASTEMDGFRFVFVEAA